MYAMNTKRYKTEDGDGINRKKNENNKSYKTAKELKLPDIRSQKYCSEWSFFSVSETITGI